MPAAKCDPGQGAVPAAARMPVVLRPVGGSFGSGGSVYLRASSGGGCPMTVEVNGGWDQKKILAYVPPNNPGTGEADETFAVVISVDGGSTLETTDPLRIVGPVGNYPDPPVHPPQADSPSKRGERGGRGRKNARV